MNDESAATHLLPEPIKPRRFTRPDAEQSQDHLYFTPMWLIRLWRSYVDDASDSCLIVDPCAADGRIGFALGADRMYDLTPRHQDVQRQDFFELTRAKLEEFGGRGVSVLFVMNPPFNLAKEFIEHALKLCGPKGGAWAVLRCGTCQQVGWDVHPSGAILPKRRVQFEITMEYAAQLDALAKSKGRKPTHKASPAAVTGFELGSPGDDHGIFLFEAGTVKNCGTVYVDVDPYLGPENGPDCTFVREALQVIRLWDGRMPLDTLARLIPVSPDALRKLLTPASAGHKPKGWPEKNAGKLAELFRLEGDIVSLRHA